MNVWELIYKLRDLEQACTEQGVEDRALDAPIFLHIELADGSIVTGKARSLAVLPQGILLCGKEHHPSSSKPGTTG